MDFSICVGRSSRVTFLSPPYDAQRTQDAGRKFWQRLRSVITGNEFSENMIAKALYVIEVDNQVMAMMATRVDDLMWAVYPDYAHHVDAVLKEFVVNTDRIQEWGTLIWRQGSKTISRLLSLGILFPCNRADRANSLSQFGTWPRRTSHRKRSRAIAQRSGFARLGSPAEPT